jgi:hypothetical protein
MATVLTNPGRAINAGRMLGATPSQAEPKYVGLGTGAGTAAAADTALFTEVVTGSWAGYARASAAGTQVTTTVTNDTAQWQDTFTAPSSTQAITNAGNLDATTAGNLHIHGDFAVINLLINDTLQITIKDQKN